MLLADLKRATKKHIPPGVLSSYYAVEKLPRDPDVHRLLAFLHRGHPSLSFWKRLFLVERLVTISWRVACSHTQSDVLAFIETILSLAPEQAGCVVEAGCYKGGSTARFSLAAKLAKRRLIVFDSFEGIPENDEAHKKNIFGGPASFPRGSYCGRLEEVKATVRRFGSIRHCEFVKGWFEDTLPGFTGPIAAVYLDVDLVASTRTCLKYLYPQLIPGGVLYSHDGHLPVVIKVFDDDEFWEREVGCPKPFAEGLGKTKLIKIQKPAACQRRPGQSALPRHQRSPVDMELFQTPQRGSVSLVRAADPQSEREDS